MIYHWVPSINVAHSHYRFRWLLLFKMKRWHQSGGDGFGTWSWSDHYLWKSKPGSDGSDDLAESLVNFIIYTGYVYGELWKKHSYLFVFDIWLKPISFFNILCQNIIVNFNTLTRAETTDELAGLSVNRNWQKFHRQLFSESVKSNFLRKNVKKMFCYRSTDFFF